MIFAKMLFIGVAAVLALVWLICVITHRTGVTLWRLSDD